jgi:hypothetical protein
MACTLWEKPLSPPQTEIDALSAVLDSLDLILEITGRALANRETLSAVEGRVQAAHQLLERATYQAGINIKDPKAAGHPVVVLWGRWSEAVEKLKLQIDSLAPTVSAPE